jgi:cell division protein FtsB
MNKHIRFIKPRFWALLLGLLALTCTVVYSSQRRYMAQQADTIAALEAELTSLLDENAVLQRRIDFTYTDEFIEREARSKLGLIKEDEILFETND